MVFIAILVLVGIGVIQAYVQVLVVGGTGNLATKYIWPAFEHLRRRDASDKPATLLRYWAGGVSDKAFGESMIKGIPDATKLGVRYARLRDGEDYKALSVNFDWAAPDMTGLIVYLAVPPQFFETVNLPFLSCANLSWIRVVVEKPFGHDLSSAQSLAKSLRGIFSDDELFLMDHYMGKRGVHGLRTFLTANHVEYSKWWPKLSHIQITMHEADTVATRTAFFDKYVHTSDVFGLNAVRNSVGIVRDVMANHLTLLWGLVAPPLDSPANRRLDLVHQFTFDQKGVILGQYDGYAQDVSLELKKPSSTTATAAAVCFQHKDRRRLFASLTAGKGLSQRQVRVALHFGTTCTLLLWQPILDYTDAAQEGDLWTYPLGDGSFLDLHVRTCYVIDRTLHSKRVSEGDVLKLTERYQSIGARMLLQWVVDTTSRGQPDEDCANLFLRVLISIPPKDPRVLREFGSVLAAQASRQESPVMRALFNQLLALFEK
ncbi:hypothetical protein DYB32_001741 [Aphanomyces invadans]|uniref:Glucose-6-phosphate dehydrogenase NAD-binding domain-containing protein n=1 Tax=Aphanomyces invadans TaxID=157072 RepID=A0A3R7D532_9STRA|nr:hypothetical protein DYB32_001741 [Aphanomyces invadans]